MRQLWQRYFYFTPKVLSSTLGGASGVPANAITARDGSYLTDRAGDYITTR